MTSSRGSRTGADDYVRKPFDLQELELAIEAVLRRLACAAAADAHVACSTTASWRSTWTRLVGAARGKPVHLTPTEFRLLAHLVHRQRGPVPHEELLREVWGPDYVDETANLAVYIRYLREKLEEDTGRHPRYICTGGASATASAASKDKGGHGFQRKVGSSEWDTTFSNSL